MDKKLFFIRVSAFLCGMSVMGVELAASRLLAPYFSSSTPVWSVIIGTIMASMSLGNYFGGRLADRTASDAPIYRRILFAGVWIAVIPFAGKYIIVGMAGFAGIIAGEQLMVVGSLLACLILFAVPMALLGMVSPFLVRFASSDAQNAGRVTGSIYAVSTAGSIVGTFLPSFITIPYMGTNKTYLFFALILIVLSLFYAVSRKKRIAVNAIAAILCITALFAPMKPNYAFWQSGLLYEGESIYNYLRVSQDNQYRYFSTNVLFGVQSMLPLEMLESTPGVKLTGAYYDNLFAACCFLPDFEADKPVDVLLLGLGTGTFASMLQKVLPGSSCTGVEIDADIIGLAHYYFGVTTDICKTVAADGRAFVLRDESLYDIIVIDAYQDITIPFHMATTEFFGLCLDRLKPGGIIACNINMNTTENSAVVDAISATLRTQFSEVYSYDVPYATNTLLFAPTGGNLELFARNLEKAETREISARSEPDEKSEPGGQGEILYRVASGMKASLAPAATGGTVLTDDLAPVEMLAASVLQTIVAEDLAFARQRVASYGGGISGLWKYVTEML